MCLPAVVLHSSRLACLQASGVARLHLFLSSSRLCAPLHFPSPCINFPCPCFLISQAALEEDEGPEELGGSSPLLFTTSSLSIRSFLSFVNHRLRWRRTRAPRSWAAGGAAASGGSARRTSFTRRPRRRQVGGTVHLDVWAWALSRGTHAIGSQAQQRFAFGREAGLPAPIAALALLLGQTPMTLCLCSPARSRQEVQAQGGLLLPPDAATR